MSEKHENENSVRSTYRTYENETLQLTKQLIGMSLLLLLLLLLLLFSTPNKKFQISEVHLYQFVA
jgi:hypothetical protein